MDNIATETIVDSENSANNQTTTYTYNHSIPTGWRASRTPKVQKPSSNMEVRKHE
jgi:hypothetical protein